MGKESELKAEESGAMWYWRFFQGRDGRSAGRALPGQRANAVQVA